MLPRQSEPLILEALADTRVVFVAGARQVGKSTLARAIARGDQPARGGHAMRRGHPAEEFSLDRRATREAALADPEGFIAGLSGPVFIDEIQRAPELLLAIKDVVDRDLTPGRFLLTGSANILTARTVKDALTGRMETIPLWPLAQSEIHEADVNFVDALFAREPPRISGATVGRNAFVDVAAAGGYPEARLRSGRRRARWFASYIDTTLDRDLREISDARKLDEIPRLLRLLASQAANILSYRAIAAKLDLTHDTVREYVGLLQTVFLVRLLPPWRPGIGAREVHAPKAYMVDSGLLAYLLGADERRIAADDQVTGKVLENFVVTEVLKHMDWAETDATAYHYRQRNDEVDLVLESRADEIVAIEAKAAASVGRGDVRAMETLRDGSGSRFQAGVVVCTGAQTIPLGERLWAVPISGLWA
jgi:predicted AAA+ superfamily ATPase